MSHPAADPAARPTHGAVVAGGRNGAIGHNGGLPWRMPSDLARFRELTWGKPMIMGRRTFESIGRALPGRDSIVVTRRIQARLPEGVEAATSPAEAMAIATRRAKSRDADAIALIGGAGLYAELAAAIGRWEVTLVDLAPEADTFLAPPDPVLWREVARHRPRRDPCDEADCLFLTYEPA